MIFVVSENSVALAGGCFHFFLPFGILVNLLTILQSQKSASVKWLIAVASSVDHPGVIQCVHLLSSASGLANARTQALTTSLLRSVLYKQVP
jgi:hypothetical protein